MEVFEKRFASINYICAHCRKYLIGKSLRSLRDRNDTPYRSEFILERSHEDSQWPETLELLS